MRMSQKFVSIMAYKLDLRKSVANHSGRMSLRQILQVFKDKPISRATIFRVLKDFRDFNIVWSCFKVVCVIAIISTQFMMQKSEVRFIIQND